jgi:hypothetical protein
MLVELVQHAGAADGGLEAYLRQMMLAEVAPRVVADMLALASPVARAPWVVAACRPHTSPRRFADGPKKEDRVMSATALALVDRQSGLAGRSLAATSVY